MKQVIKDLMKPTGKWSLKRIIAVLVITFVLVLGTFIVISDKVLDREVNRYAIDVFDSLLIFEASLLGITEAGKMIMSRNKKEDEEEETNDKQ